MKSKHFYQGNAGFTLIEVLITVALTGILAAITAPSLVSWLENKKIDDVTASVEGAIKEAQSTSIRRSQACTLTITSTEVSATPSNCLPTGTRTISATGSSRNIAVAVTNNVVKFTAKGTTLDTEPFIISRINNGTVDGKMKCVVVSAGLGAVRTGVYDADDPPTIPASMEARPVQSDPVSASIAAAIDAWDIRKATRDTAVNAAVNSCKSSSS
jgi:prepilin-type N-terminal cleavage/methylation domain-containing protein